MASEQQASIEGSGNIIIQSSGDYAHITIGVPYLSLIQAKTRIDQAQARVKSEIDLLNPFNCAVELVGREKDLESLWQWLHTDRPIAVRTLTGRAGAGKTRLAVELMTRLSNEASCQWRSGFVTNRELRRFSDQQNLSTWGWQSPTLVTVDYAATLAEPLKICLQELSENIQNCKGKPLRLLLLEREASAEEGWFRSLLGSSWSGAGVTDLFDPLEPIRVQKLDTAANRRQVLTSMLRVSAKYLNSQLPTVPAPGQSEHFDRQLENLVWADPLYLMMAALVSIRSGIVEALALSRTDLAFRLTEREIDRLKLFAPAQGGELLVHMAAYATLCNGLSADQALEAATQEGNALQLQYLGGYGALKKALHEALPGPGNGIAPVVPDVIGEALVLSALREETHQAAVVLRGAKQVGRVVPAFVVRAAQDFSGAGLIEPLEWLQALIEAGSADDIGLLLEIEGAMPEQTLVLREKAAEVSRLLVDRFSELVSQRPEENFRSELGRLTNNLAARLSDLGRREEALEKAQQAVRIYEQLAQARPDAFLPSLALSLNNLATMLSELGRREEALEKAQQAVRIYEQFPQARPDAFLHNLALSLNTLATRLSDLGRREEALEKAQQAVRIREQLAQARPDAFLPYLAGSLDNLATRLSDLGRREEALEKVQQAVRIREQLAQARPDAFLPDLALSLNNLANRLSDLGRREEALEKAQQAVRIYEQLAQARPDAFLPYLAGSLNNLAAMLGELGRHEEALEKAQQAVRMCEQLAQARPDAFLPYLAASLNNLAARLSELGRSEEALEKAQQAVRIYEQLAQARPDAFLPELALSLNTLATRLSELGRREEALEKAQQAVRIREQLAQARPDAFLPELALSLNTLAARLSELGRSEEALEEVQQAVRIYEQLAQARPDAFLLYLARSISVEHDCLRALDRLSEAVTADETALRLLIPFFQQQPLVYARLMAAMYREYVDDMAALGREPDLELLAPIIAIFEKLQQNQTKE